mmetsp:Transcript_30757/g.49333  ORF Transcript_30757/g.49333 Transcript_30757/m.49333 type:complete len:443 (-) Transcript_30757:305-1633(-)|eukprot:CAMPEP_0197036602 /NCGR_PEP_ID=MMETSP1384-20130603/14066_1 /TAXON_ID=29189 /ORGANISM="Ammonia sp." /LENGTH=442 /DNA_ID=CAMNT_0042466799 /DNA_START=84 /DNA_END=1412 /DNA_ORIENTATION=-
MGTLCCTNSGPGEEREINQHIDAHMKNAINAEKITHRILLLGPGDTGKTTIIKQMRKIHNGVIAEEQLDSHAAYIRTQIVKYMQTLCVQSIKLNIALSASQDDDDDSDAQASRDFICNLSAPCDLSPDVVQHMKVLWNNDGIRQTLEQRAKFQIPDNVAYFFDQRLDDIGADDYVPTFEDYLRIRMRTSGMNQEEFLVYFGRNGQTLHVHDHHDNNGKHGTVKSASATHANADSNNTPKATEYKDLELEIARDEHNGVKNNNSKKAIAKGKAHKFVFIDVGGQRSERSKWMNMMRDEIHAVVYVVAIAEYDLTCFEDSKTLRLHEALTLFEQVLQKGFLKNKTVTLFFNKYDLLVQKLQDDTKTTIKDHFPEFPDDKDERDPVVVAEWVYQQFLAIFRRMEPNAHITPHYHCTYALDTEQVESLMGDIQSDLIRSQLKMAGF